MMDFHGMKRKKLQALCKKHGIPANSTNLEMADRLTSLLKGNDELTSRGQSSSSNILEEEASRDEIPKFNKVRFNSETEVRFYVASLKKRGRWRRSKVKKQTQDNPVNLSVENVDCTATRSRAQKATEGEASKIIVSVGKKRGRKEVKGGNDGESGVDRDKLGPPAVELSNNVVDNSFTKLSRRKLRSSMEENEKSGDEFGEDLPFWRKDMPRRSSRKRGNAKGGDEVLLLNSASEGNNIANGDAELGYFNRDPHGVETETEVMEVHKKVVQLKETTTSLRGSTSRQKFGKHKKEVGYEIHDKEDDGPGKGLRRSKRKLGKSADSKVFLTEDEMKFEGVTSSSSSKLVNEACGFHEELGDGGQDEKPLNCQGRNTNRQKLSVLLKDKIENDGLQVSMGTGKQSQCVDMDGKGSELAAIGEVSKGSDTISPPSDLPGRSRRNPAVFDTTAPRYKTAKGTKKQRKLLSNREVFVPEAPLRRSRRNACGQKSIATSNKVNEEAVPTEHGHSIKKSSKRIPCNVSKCDLDPAAMLTDDAIKIQQQSEFVRPDIAEEFSTAENDRLQVGMGTKRQSQCTSLDGKSSEIEVNGEPSKGNARISLASDFPRRSRRNAAVFDTTSPTDETSKGTKKPRELPQDEEVYMAEAPLRRQRRNACRHKSTATSNKVNGTVDGVGKQKQIKQRGEPVLREETVATEHGPSVEKPSKGIACNASNYNWVSVAVDAAKNQHQSTFEMPIITEEALTTENLLTSEAQSTEEDLTTENLLTSEAPSIVDTTLALPEAVESKTNPDPDCELVNCHHMTKGSSERSCAEKKVVTAENLVVCSEIEEVIDVVVNLEQNPVSTPVKFQVVSASQDAPCLAGETLAVDKNEFMMVGYGKEKSVSDIHRGKIDERSCQYLTREVGIDNNILVEHDPDKSQKIETIVASSKVGALEDIFVNQSGEPCTLIEVEKGLKIEELPTVEMIDPFGSNQDTHTTPFDRLSVQEATNVENLENAKHIVMPVTEEIDIEDDGSKFDQSGDLERNFDFKLNEAEAVALHTSWCGLAQLENSAEFLKLNSENVEVGGDLAMQIPSGIIGSLSPKVATSLRQAPEEVISAQSQTIRKSSVSRQININYAGEECPGYKSISFGEIICNSEISVSNAENGSNDQEIIGENKKEKKVQSDNGHASQASVDRSFVLLSEEKESFISEGNFVDEFKFATGKRVHELFNRNGNTVTAGNCQAEVCSSRAIALEYEMTDLINVSKESDDKRMRQSTYVEGFDTTSLEERSPDEGVENFYAAKTAFKTLRTVNSLHDDKEHHKEAQSTEKPSTTENPLTSEAQSIEDTTLALPKAAENKNNPDQDSGGLLVNSNHTTKGYSERSCAEKNVVPAENLAACFEIGEVSDVVVNLEQNPISTTVKFQGVSASQDAPCLVGDTVAVDKNELKMVEYGKKKSVSDTRKGKTDDRSCQSLTGEVGMDNDNLVEPEPSKSQKIETMVASSEVGALEDIFVNRSGYAREPRTLKEVGKVLKIEELPTVETIGPFGSNQDTHTTPFDRLSVQEGANVENLEDAMHIVMPVIEEVDVKDNGSKFNQNGDSERNFNLTLNEAEVVALDTSRCGLAQLENSVEVLKLHSENVEVGGDVAVQIPSGIIGSLSPKVGTTLTHAREAKALAGVVDAVIDTCNYINPIYTDFSDKAQYQAIMTSSATGSSVTNYAREECPSHQSISFGETIRKSEISVGNAENSINDGEIIGENKKEKKEGSDNGHTSWAAVDRSFVLLSKGKQSFISEGNFVDASKVATDKCVQLSNGKGNTMTALSETGTYQAEVCSSRGIAIEHEMMELMNVSDASSGKRMCEPLNGEGFDITGSEEMGHDERVENFYAANTVFKTPRTVNSLDDDNEHPKAPRTVNSLHDDNEHPKAAHEVAANSKLQMGYSNYEEEVNFFVRDGMQAESWYQPVSNEVNNEKISMLDGATGVEVSCQKLFIEGKGCFDSNGNKEALVELSSELINEKLTADHREQDAERNCNADAATGMPISAEDKNGDLFANWSDYFSEEEGSECPLEIQVNHNSSHSDLADKVNNFDDSSLTEETFEEYKEKIEMKIKASESYRRISIFKLEDIKSNERDSDAKLPNIENSIDEVEAVEVHNNSLCDWVSKNGVLAGKEINHVVPIREDMELGEQNGETSIPEGLLGMEKSILDQGEQNVLEIDESISLASKSFTPPRDHEPEDGNESHRAMNNNFNFKDNCSGVTKADVDVVPLINTNDIYDFMDEANPVNWNDDLNHKIPSDNDQRNDRVGDEVEMKISTQNIEDGMITSANSSIFGIPEIGISGAPVLRSNALSSHVLGDGDINDAVNRDDPHVKFSKDRGNNIIGDDLSPKYDEISDRSVGAQKREEYVNDAKEQLDGHENEVNEADYQGKWTDCLASNKHSNNDRNLILAEVESESNELHSSDDMIASQEFANFKCFENIYSMGCSMSGKKSSYLHEVQIQASCERNFFSRDGTRDEEGKLDVKDSTENSKRENLEEVMENVVRNEQVASKIAEAQLGVHEHCEDRDINLDNNPFTTKEKLGYERDKNLEAQVEEVTGTKHAILSGPVVPCDLDHPKNDFSNFIFKKMVAELDEDDVFDEVHHKWEWISHLEKDQVMAKVVDQSHGHSSTGSRGVAADQKNSPCMQKEEDSNILARHLESPSVMKGKANETCLIAKTPKKLPQMHDMKENAESVKKQVGSITSTNKLSKRQPLGDIRFN